MNPSTQEILIFQLHHCANLFHRGRGPHGEGGRHGLRGQGRVIALLKEKGGLGQGELADMLGIQRPSLSEVLDKLEAGGLVERRQNERDRRQSDVVITDQGLEKARKVEEARRNRAEALLAGLSQEEQQNLSGLLGKLIAGMEAGIGAEGCGHGRGAGCDGGCGHHDCAGKHHDCGGHHEHGDAFPRPEQHGRHRCAGGKSGCCTPKP